MTTQTATVEDNRNFMQNVCTKCNQFYNAARFAENITAYINEIRTRIHGYHRRTTLTTHKPSDETTIPMCLHLQYGSCNSVIKQIAINIRTQLLKHLHKIRRDKKKYR